MKIVFWTLVAFFGLMVILMVWAVCKSAGEHREWEDEWINHPPDSEVKFDDEDQGG